MDIQTIVVGAGIVGLAVARNLAISGKEVLVVERHKHIGQETSSRNSEVIHAGIYYPKNSLKAKLCVSGKQMLYDYCNSHQVTHQRLGKLIVATCDEQSAELKKIYQKALDNGVDDLRYIEQDELQALEPKLKGQRAILSPSTGIINTHELMLAYQGDIENNGGVVVLNTHITSGRKIEGGFVLNIDDGEKSEISCEQLINCAGLSAQSVARSVDGIPPSSIPKRYISRGCYFTQSGKAPFSHLIYPMPNNVGLGIHLTLDLQGQARFGPDTQWIDNIDYTVDPKRGNSFYNAVRQYYPDLQDGQLEPAYSGIRSKLSGPGESPADFMIQDKSAHQVPGWVALYGIESPGLTASLAIAEMVKQTLV